MDYSFNTLGSELIKERILEDIDGLFEISEEKKLIPMFMIVGPLFMDITTVQSLVFELTILNLEKETDENRSLISELIQSKRLSIYKQCEETNGLFDFDDIRKVQVVFDPDESYISLLCLDSPSIKSKNIKISEYTILKYKNNEILPEVLDFYNNQ